MGTGAFRSHGRAAGFGAVAALAAAAVTGCGAASSSAASGAASSSAAATTGSGSLALTGTFAERIRPSVLARVNISSLESAGSSVPGGLSEILTPSTLYLKAPALTQQLPRSARPGQSPSTASR